MAATYGRLTGKPGVCITTLGPGALNLATGAAYALLGAMPMVMLTGQKGIMSSRQAKFQIVDVVGTFKPLTKLSLQIVSTSTIPTLVRDAFRIATQERPGPVLLELPEDIAGEEAESVAMVAQHPIEIPVAHRASLDRAAEMILNAKRPLIHVGRRGFPAAKHDGNCRIRSPHPNSILHDPDGKRYRARRHQIVYGYGSPQRTRLCPRSDRSAPT